MLQLFLGCTILDNYKTGGTPFLTPISNSPYLLIKSPQ